MRKLFEMTLRSHSKDFRLSNSSLHLTPGKHFNNTSMDHLAILLRDKNASCGIYSGRQASQADTLFLISPRMNISCGMEKAPLLPAGLSWLLGPCHSITYLAFNFFSPPTSATIISISSGSVSVALYRSISEVNNFWHFQSKINICLSVYLPTYYLSWP